MTFYLVKRTQEVLVEADNPRGAIDIGHDLFNDMAAAPRVRGNINRVTETSIKAEVSEE